MPAKQSQRFEQRPEGVLVPQSLWRALTVALMGLEYSCRGGGIQLPPTANEETLLDWLDQARVAGADIEQLT